MNNQPRPPCQNTSQLNATKYRYARGTTDGGERALVTVVKGWACERASIHGYFFLDKSGNVFGHLHGSRGNTWDGLFIRLQYGCHIAYYENLGMPRHTQIW